MRVSSLTQASRLSLNFDAVEYMKVWELRLVMARSVVPCNAMFVHRYDNVACMTCSLDGLVYTLATSAKLEVNTCVLQINQMQHMSSPFIPRTSDEHDNIKCLLGWGVKGAYEIICHVYLHATCHYSH